MLVQLTDKHHWHQPINMPGMTFKCWYCDTVTGAHQGYYYGPTASREAVQSSRHRIYICGNCKLPTFTDSAGSFFVPAAVDTAPIRNLPHDVAALYEELRATSAQVAPSLAMLGCRKMLMHVAVEKGAAGNQNFLTYVNYLADNHIIPEGSKGWVDKLRGYGNEATHTIDVVDKAEASKAMRFVEMLLRMVYEFPADA